MLNVDKEIYMIIFGLSFAIFLTLLFVPALYYLDYIIRIKNRRRKNLKKIKAANV